MEKSGRNGPEAAQIAAHNTRERKQELSPTEVLASHKALAEEYGNQAEKVIAEARARVERQDRKPEDLLGKAREAVTYSRSSNFEREAVIDERTLMRDALRRGMGETTFDHVRAEFDARQKQGDLRQLKGEKHDTGRSFTTPETIANERANVAHVMKGQDTVQPILQQEQAAQQAASRAIFNPAQRRVIAEVLTSPDRIHGIQGLAGTGKTTVLSSVREGAERSGFIVQGFAPTNRAAGALRDAGIEATTLQSFLTKGNSGGTAAADPASRHLYMLDESSLASTKQMRDFLDKIKPQDRVLLIGDTRQHQGVDAGRPFEQMQDAGMRTSRLDQIVRQRNSPELLKAVEHLSKGETVEGVRLLREQGRVTELPDSKERIQAIAKDYVGNPEKTIVISSDNKSRQLINQAIRGELQTSGSLGNDGQEFRSLIHRSDMTGADREWAARYQPGDVLKYTKGSKAYGVERDSLSVVTSISARDNSITVTRQDGQSVSYDPRRLSGVNVYREEPREFATGDRLQFTATDKDLNVANRDLGTITKIEPGQLTVRMDGKEDRTVSFDPAQMRHIDHGYAVTSHVSQGLTEGRVIVNIDTDSSRNLINTRLAYVTISRAETDARIYTNDADTLGARLATDVSKTAAVDFRQPMAAPRRPTVEPEVHQYSDPNHRIAAVATAYMQRPDSSVIIAPDRAERQELNQLIRADLQAQGTLSPDSKSLAVHVQQPIANAKLAAQYTPGDLIQYGQGSPELHGINHNSVGTVLASDPQRNALTVQTSTGDWATYSPHLTKTMTAESAVYRVEQREIAHGERIQITSAMAELGIRKGEFGTVTAISESRELDVQLDKGETVHLNQRQAQHIEHGYAVEGIKAGAPERIIVTQEAALESQREIASLTRSGREVSVYTSDGSSPAQALNKPTSLPQQQQINATANVIAQDNALTATSVVAPEATQVQHRRGMGI